MLWCRYFVSNTDRLAHYDFKSDKYSISSSYRQIEDDSREYEEELISSTILNNISLPAVKLLITYRQHFFTCCY